MQRVLSVTITVSICLGAAPIVHGQGRSVTQPRVAALAQSLVLPDCGGDWYTDATAINNRGQIAGWAARDDQWIAFVWSSREGYTDIAERAFPRDIDDRGEVVGVRSRCEEDDCQLEGFVWSVERAQFDVRVVPE